MRYGREREGGGRRRGVESAEERWRVKREKQKWEGEG